MEEQIIEAKYNNEICPDYREDITNITRTRIAFLWLPCHIENKLYWLRKVNIIERKYILYKWIAYDGWNCFYWENCGEHWDILKYKALKN